MPYIYRKPTYMRYLYILLFCFSFLFSNHLFSSHARAGEVCIEYLGNKTIKAKIFTYTKIVGANPGADKDQVSLNWGDGTNSLFTRVNGPINMNGFPNGEDIGNNIKKNIYEGTSHPYSGNAPFYVVSFADSLRNGNIININSGSSDGVVFYIEDTLFSSVFSLQNHSPVLLYPPIDFANVGYVFSHNPVAFDAEGDSLSFEILPPKQALGTDVPAYQYPNQLMPGANNVFSVNSLTGHLTWTVPQMSGIFNVAVQMREFRNGVLLSTMVRDYQIIVGKDSIYPPESNGFSMDTTIQSGQSLQLTYHTSVKDTAANLTLSCFGGPLQFLDSAAIFSTNKIRADSIDGFFSWTPSRNQFSKIQYYYFAVQSLYSTSSSLYPLTTLKSFRVRVVDPLFNGVEDAEEIQMGLYPNPATDFIDVLFPDNTQRAIVVKDILGSTVFQANTSNSTFQINTTQLSSGQYFITTTSEGGSSTSKLFYKQ